MVKQQKPFTMTCVCGGILHLEATTPSVRANNPAATIFYF